MKLDCEITDADWREFRRRRVADDLALGLAPEAATAAAERAERQTRERLEWLRCRFVRLAELWSFLGDYWNDFADSHPEIDLEDPGDVELEDPPEQAELEAIEAEIAAARDHDIWPRHLYFSGI